MDYRLRNMLDEMEPSGRFDQEKGLRQHGSTTVYAHSVNVARVSLKLSDKIPLNIDNRSLIRGALLHDYFLYDWHIPDDSRSLHGFAHPGIALKNAGEDFVLNSKEENIIQRHMFPLTPVPPACREAWIVCIADKYCALRETATHVYGMRRKIKELFSF